MIDDNELYKKVSLKCFPEIKDKLLLLHTNKLFPIKKRAITVAWTKENFLDLYDEVSEIAKSMSTKILIAKFFITPAHSFLGVHVDSNYMSNKNWALNIPILTHPDNHYMTWYDYQGEFDHVTNEYSRSLFPKNFEKLVPLDYLVLSSPHYVKIGIFHGIDNPTPTPRIVLTIRFINSFT